MWDDECVYPFSECLLGSCCLCGAHVCFSHECLLCPSPLCHLGVLLGQLVVETEAGLEGPAITKTSWHTWSHISKEIGVIPVLWDIVVNPVFFFFRVLKPLQELCSSDHHSSQLLSGSWELGPFMKANSLSTTQRGDWVRNPMIYFPMLRLKMFVSTWIHGIMIVFMNWKLF